MNNQVQSGKGKCRRLKNVTVNEVSLVDQPANMRKFLLYKRQEVDKDMAELEELKKKMEEATAALTAKDAEITTLKAEVEKAKGSAPVKKVEMTDEQFAGGFSETVEVLKVGKVVSKKNLDLLKAAVDALTKIIGQVQAEVEKDAVNKSFETLKPEEQQKALETIKSMNDKLDGLIATRTGK